MLVDARMLLLVDTFSFLAAIMLAFVKAKRLLLINMLSFVEFNILLLIDILALADKLEALAVPDVPGDELAGVV